MAIRPIDQITVQFSLPRRPGDGAPGHDVRADVLFGARIRELTRHNADQVFRLTLALPRTLAPGERHQIDAVGEVTSTSDGLQQGYAYGMAWSFPDGVRG